MEIPYSLIEYDFARTRYASKKIKIGEPAIEENIKDNIKLLSNYLLFIPQDLGKCKSSSIFKIEEEQVWFYKYTKIRKYITYIYQCIKDCKCEVHSIPYKDNTRFPNFILCSIKLD